MRKTVTYQPFCPRPAWCLVWMVCFVMTSGLYAQNTPMDKTSSEQKPSFQPAISIGLNTGTHALWGVDATIGVLEAVNFRLSYNSVQANLSDFTLDAGNLGLNNQSLNLDADLNLSTLGFLVDWPFTRKRNLRLMAGAMVELDNRVAVTGRFQESIFINDYELTPDRLGQIGTTYRTKSSIYPYLGVGFGRSVAANRLTFAFEAGVYMRGEPEFTVESTGVLAGNEANGPVLSNNLSSLQWHPSIGFRLGYSIGIKKEPVDSTRLDPLPVQPKEDIIAEDEPMPQEQEPQVVQAPVKPKTPFLAMQGQVVDTATGENLSFVIVDMYQVMPDGSKQKALSQRYPGGVFRIDLQRGATYELRISNYQYMENVVTIQADTDPQKTEVTRSFTLNRQ